MLIVCVTSWPVCFKLNLPVHREWSNGVGIRQLVLTSKPNKVLTQILPEATTRSTSCYSDIRCMQDHTYRSALMELYFLCCLVYLPCVHLGLIVFVFKTKNTYLINRGSSVYTIQEGSGLFHRQIWSWTRWSLLLSAWAGRTCLSVYHLIVVSTSCGWTIIKYWAHTNVHPSWTGEQWVEWASCHGNATSALFKNCNYAGTCLDDLWNLVTNHAERWPACVLHKSISIVLFWLHKLCRSHSLPTCSQLEVRTTQWTHRHRMHS